MQGTINRIKSDTALSPYFCCRILKILTSGLLQNKVYMSIYVALSSEGFAGMVNISQTGVFDLGIVTSVLWAWIPFPQYIETHGADRTSTCLCSKLENNATLITMLKGNVLSGKRFVS